MVILSIIRISQGNNNLPPVAEFKSLPTLFGISVYSFMLHNLLPGIVTPMKSKKRINWILAGVYATVLLFYLLLTITGAFAFRICEMNDLYNLDFFDPSDSIVQLIFGVYLALFPFFVLSTRFPINTISLRENLKALFMVALKPWIGDKKLPLVIDRLVFTTFALVLPIIISFSTQQNSLLISITGAFPGVGMQYLIPAALVLMAQYTMKKQFGTYHNKYKSPFSHFVVIIMILAWSVISILLIIINMSFNPPMIEEHTIQ